MDTSKVSGKWQVVIPRRVREAEQIHSGSEVAFERTPHGVLLRPIGAGKRLGPEAGYGNYQNTASGGNGG